MKLLHYTYRKLSFFMLLFMAVWGVLFYYAIIEEIVDETDDTLENYADILIRKALQDSTVFETSTALMSSYTFRPLTEEEGKHYRDRYYETVVYIETEDEEEPMRVFQTAFKMPNGQCYELTLMISIVEREDMIEALFSYLSVLFLLFLLSTSIGIRLVLKQTFRPLNRLMDWLHNTHPDQKIPPLENPTEIREFRELTQAAMEMGNRAHKIYEEQKQFIENASHELQTPLAIAQGKVELLAESEGMTEKHLQELDTIHTTLGRAIKLNKSLLLLSRIENGQYSEIENIQADELIDRHLPDLMEIYAHKQLHITRIKGEKAFIFRCDSSLAHILLSNILKNALLHTPEGGQLSIATTPNSLTVKNSGDTPLNKELLFRRFYHHKPTRKESTGLGLAIAFTIAQAASLQLSYEWNEGMHIFKIVKEIKK